MEYIKMLYNLSVMVVSKILYGDIPDMKMMVLFCILLGIFAIGAPGVPGGTVMAYKATK